MKENIKFMRLTTGEEVVSQVTELENEYNLKYPLIVEVETFMEEGRQLLYMKEYLPQSVVSVKEVNIPKDLVIISVQVAEEFLDQFEQASEFFYNADVKTTAKKKRKVSADEVSKVVSLFEAMADKKDKPVH